MVKNIIKRIIVGVGIALCLYAIKGNLLLGVSAKSTNIAPSNICAYSSSSTTCNWANVTTYSIYEENFYGNTFGANSSTRNRVIWRFLPTTELQNKTYDIDFILYLEGDTTYLESNKGYITNNSGNIFTCSIDNTRFGNFGTSSVNGASGSTTVSCDNVYIDDNFKFYIIDFIIASRGTVAISSVTLTDSQTPAIQQEIQSVNDNITNDEIDDNKASSDIDSMNDKIASNSSISQLLTLPIQLYQNILNSVSGSCSSFNLGSLYNHQLTLPCINLQNLLGSTLYGIIDVLISGLFILSFRKKMVDIFNHLTSLNDRGNELE